MSSTCLVSNEINLSKQFIGINSQNTIGKIMVKKKVTKQINQNVWCLILIRKQNGIQISMLKIF